MLLGVRFIPNNRIGIVEKRFSGKGSVKSGFIALNGEAGYQPNVLRGKRGVWNEPLLPGKYAFNTYAGKIVQVPTTNIILKWIHSEVGAHRFDENLSEVSLITKDAFEPSLPLSVVIHIDYPKAPLVIQRFGDIKRLVEQTLDPMVAAYFKEGGSTSGSVMEGLLILLLSEKMGVMSAVETAKEERSPEVETLRASIMDSLKKPPEQPQAD
jgi:uncharacterized membrane protein YqiK